MPTQIAYGCPFSGFSAGLSRDLRAPGRSQSDGWHADCLDPSGRKLEVHALVNATGCWVESVRQAIGLPSMAIRSQARWPFIPRAVLARLVQSYGTQLEGILEGCASSGDPGEHFGAGLTAAEVSHLLQREWALTAEDILWRRSKLGLHLPVEGVARLDRYLHSVLAERPTEATL